MIFIFHGKNTFLSRREAVKQLGNLTDDESENDFLEIDAQTTEPDVIISNFQTHDMFSESRVIFLKRLYSRKDKSTLTEILIETFQEDSFEIDVVIWEEKKVPVNTRYLKYLKKDHSVYESPQLNKRTFMTWAKAEVEERGISIDKDALRELTTRSNYDPERFINDLEKISVLGEQKIDLESVAAHTTDTYEHDIWALIDAINTSEGSEVTKIMSNLLSQKVEPHYILSMIFRNTRILTEVKYLSEKGADNREIAKTLKLPPFTVPSLTKSASNTTFEKLGVLYEKLTNLDYQIKTGAIDPELGLTLLSTILTSK